MTPEQLRAMDEVWLDLERRLSPPVTRESLHEMLRPLVVELALRDVEAFS